MVLVSIVGDFDSSVLPLFYEFKDDITKHILVYDDFSKDVIKAHSIKNGIEKFQKKYEYDFELIDYVLDEDSLEAIYKCSRFLLSQVKDPKDLYVNTTDGLSTITTILGYKIIKNGANIVSYDMYDNQYNLLNVESLTKHNIENKLNIQDHFILKGYSVEVSNTALLAKKYEKQIKSIFENYAKQYNKFIKLPPSNKLVKEISKEFKNLKEIFKRMELDEYNIKDPVVTGSLFELYIYNIVRTLEIDDIETGLKIARKYKKSNIENEFDILIMKDNHLHMIECKYKNFVKLEELIYKYIALSDLIDEDGKMIIVTKKEPMYNDKIDNSEKSGRVYKRGKLSNIQIMGAVQKDYMKFKLDVESFFKLYQ